MISEDHYNECRTILYQLIEKQTPTYREAVESKKSTVKTDFGEAVIYTNGFDPTEHRERMLNEISASDDFIKLYTNLTSRNYRDRFYLFGREFYIDVKKKLISILRFSLALYDAINRYDQIKVDFDNLHLSLYEDKFTIEIQTIMEHFDSMEMELLNQTELNISIKKQPNGSQTCIKYVITDSKSDQNDYLQDPLTVIDIVTGILRIYKSSRINYIMNTVEYSSGCPEFLKTESSLFTVFTTIIKDYVINIDEIQEFKEFFQNAYLSEDQIRMAIQRFSMACGRESDHDRLLDLVFALEILFGKGDADSIKHRILIRLINLISSKKDVRKSLYEKMSALYGARSIIVHGLEKKPKFYTCVQNLGNYEEIVRRAFRVFIDTMKSESLDHDGMMEKLDYDKKEIYDIDTGKVDWKTP